MTDQFTKFLLWEATSRDTIDFKKIYVDMADDLVAGLLLSQIVYWYLPNKQGESKLRVHKDGFDWIAKGREDWYEEIRISAKQFDRAAKILEQKDLIAKSHYRFNGLRTVHIRLKQDKFMAAWLAQIEAQDAPVFTKGEDRSLPKGKTEVDESVRPLTESTAKTTTEIDGASPEAEIEQPNSRKEPDFLPPADEQMTLLFGGLTNPDGGERYERAEHDLQRSGWDIRKKVIKDAAIHFLAATGWAVPNATSIRRDWIKTLGEHVTEFKTADLYSLSGEVVRTAKFDLSRPGSFTNAMSAIKNARSSDRKHVADDWMNDPQYQTFAELETEDYKPWS
jgi:hypothetical protein